MANKTSAPEKKPEVKEPKVDPAKKEQLKKDKDGNSYESNVFGGGDRNRSYDYGSGAWDTRGNGQIDSGD